MIAEFEKFIRINQQYIEKCRISSTEILLTFWDNSFISHSWKFNFNARYTIGRMKINAKILMIQKISFRSLDHGTVQIEKFEFDERTNSLKLTLPEKTDFDSIYVYDQMLERGRPFLLTSFRFGKHLFIRQMPVFNDPNLIALFVNGYVRSIVPYYRNTNIQVPIKNRIGLTYVVTRSNLHLFRPGFYDEVFKRIGVISEFPLFDLKNLLISNEQNSMIRAYTIKLEEV